MMQHPTTPQSKPRRSRCINCPCQGVFHSNESITSAIKNEANTSTLIDWLSGQQHLSDAPNNNCSNRLHASILILNAIRDACRIYIEVSVAGNNEKTPKPNELAKKKSQQTIWEDSFPALSSAASTVTPTILFGRKKEPENSNKGRGDILERHKHSKETNIDDSIGSVQKQKSVNKSKIKKKIQPITISPQNINVDLAWKNLSVSNLASAWGKSADEVNAVSFPSQQTNGSHKKVPNGIDKSTTLSRTKEKDDSYLLPDSESSSKADQSDKKLDKNSSLLDMKQLSNGNNSAKNPNQTSREHDPERELVRLSSIYSAILKNQLAPYLLLELHLLVRLVSISGDIVPNVNEKVDLPFGAVLHSPKSCREFGVMTILAVESIILNLGHDVLKMLASLTSLRKHCPTLTSKIEHIIETNKSILIFDSGQKPLGNNANTPHLTLPFDHARDSRHNFKTVDLNRLYKEREELRDKFLLQLRAFQDVKGRLMEEDISSKIIRNIEDESRKMLQYLAMGNLGWFVNFFIDLLLQIGLLPIGETDIDVLKQVSDQQRLQKLHKRFTTKGTQAKKCSSSRKLVIDENISSKSNRSLPGHSFRDHQEFFALFINASDSYKFNICLKQRLSQLIVEMAAVNETKGLCQHIAKTILLAKFLGLLVFSPNWTVTEIGPADSSTRLPYNYEDTTGPINLIEQLESAWREYRLVIVVPWVVAFLKMMTWDTESKRCQYYSSIFAMLWRMKCQCTSSALNGQGSFETNMLIVSLQLDNLFNEAIGLEYSWNLPTTSLPKRHPIKNSDDAAPNNSISIATLSPIDTLPLWLSKSFLFLTTSYVQDLFEIVQHFQSANISSSKLGSSTAKKVKPRSISIGPLKDFVEPKNSWQRLSPVRSLSPITGSPWSSSKAPLADPGSEAAIKDKLIDTFFHQHTELQQLCETTIDQVIKNFSRSTLQNTITPIFKDQATSYEDFFSRSPTLTLNEYVELLQSIDLTANVKAREEMKSEFGRTIRGALELLSPPDTQPKVREMACSLALRHACDKGDQIIRSFISEEKRKLIDEFARKESKVKAGVPLKATNNWRNAEEVKRPPPFVDLNCFVDLTVLLRKFDNDEAVDILLLQQLDNAIRVSIGYLSQYFIGTIPSSHVEDFQSLVVKLIDKCLSSTNAIPRLLSAVFKSTDVICLLGRMGYLSSATICGFEQIINDVEKLKKLTIYASAQPSIDPIAAIDNVSVGTFLFQLVDGSIIKYSFLETALITSLAGDNDQSGLKQICDMMLNKFAVNLGFNGWKDDGFVIMIRLQNIMT